MREWMSIKEAADYLAVSPDWLYERRRNSQLPHYYRHGGKVRYVKQELDEWLQQTRKP
jgi:excisionase family DNA binding protein